MVDIPVLDESAEFDAHGRGRRPCRILGESQGICYRQSPTVEDITPPIGQLDSLSLVVGTVPYRTDCLQSLDIVADYPHGSYKLSYSAISSCILAFSFLSCSLPFRFYIIPLRLASIINHLLVGVQKEGL
jgi:hypothetical protein